MIGECSFDIGINFGTSTVSTVSEVSGKNHLNARKKMDKKLFSAKSKLFSEESSLFFRGSPKVGKR